MSNVTVPITKQMKNKSLLLVSHIVKLDSRSNEAYFIGELIYI